MRFPTWLSVAVSISLLWGCSSGEHEDIKQWMAESSQDLKGRAPPLPELKPFPIVSYDGLQGSDPFSDTRLEPEKKESSGVNMPDFNRPKEQLESFPLEALQMIGVISKTKGGTRYALIQADGVVYQVGKGNYIGQNFGRIISVTDSEIVLTETLQDPSGQTSDWVERKTSLLLQEGLKGKEAGK
ncbi:pilus assembly protein PilP [Rhodocyclaceae bacterium]